MARALPNLATAAEIRALAERAFDVLDAYGAGEDEDDRDSPIEEHDADHDHAAFASAREALRFCAAAAAHLRDAGLLPLLARVVEELGRWDDYAYGYQATALLGLTALLRAGAPVDDLVEELAEHAEADVRAAVAAGLSPRTPRAGALLAKLARDPSAEVRKPAKAALEEAGGVPWWTGKFESDPVARLSPEEAEQHKAALEELSAVLDERYLQVEDRDEKLARILGTLPDVLAVEAARIALAGADRYDSRLPRLGAMMIARPGGIDAFLRVCEAWTKGRYFHPDAAHARMVADTPPAVRLEACLALARYAAAPSPQERMKQGGPAHIAAEIAGKAFPPDADLGPLIDLVLGCEAVTEHRIDWLVAGLHSAFTHPEADPTPVAARIVEARLAGFPGRWKALHTAVMALLLRLPREVLRAAAEEAVRRDDDDTAAWGLGRLLFEARDSERDPEPLAMVRRFWEDARLRRLLAKAHDVRQATVSLERDELRRGALDFQAAAHVVGLVDTLWGGQASGIRVLYPRESGEEEQQRAKLRSRFEAFLGPEALRGPVTDDEWAALRRARDAHAMTSVGDWATGLHALPAGPWHPEDRAFLDRAVAACEADTDLVYPIAMAVIGKPDAALLPLFQTLVRLGPDHRDTLRDGYFAVRQALGLPPPAKGGATAAASAPREWMDEPEDDGAGDA